MTEMDKVSTEQSVINVMELFETTPMVKIAAPMVRYSKLQFRNLVRKYDCDLCYTPMILADSFCKSSQARTNEFTTNQNDVPLIVQFAANTVHDFVGAAHMVSPFCNGVDLNCGCPQRWARQQGLGCAMLEDPQMAYDMVQQCRNRITRLFTVSVKMRLQKDLRKTVEICQQLEKCGINYLAVHARTPSQSTGDIDVNALKLITEHVSIPVVANGGVRSLDECVHLQKLTNCSGVMVANALLNNPTLFTGTAITPIGCVQQWLDICYNTTLNCACYNQCYEMSEKPENLTFQCFHHHLVFMLEKVLTKVERKVFNNLQSFKDVLGFIKDKFGIVPRLWSVKEFGKTCLLDLDYSGRDELYKSLKPECVVNDKFSLFYDYNDQGKYFKSRVQEECDWSGIFKENG